MLRIHDHFTEGLTSVVGTSEYSLIVFKFFRRSLHDYAVPNDDDCITGQRNRFSAHSWPSTYLLCTNMGALIVRAGNLGGISTVQEKKAGNEQKQ